MENKYYKVMSYEEKYKDALEKARAFYETKSPDCLILESIFPELAESEDERIRKAIVELIKYNGGCLQLLDKPFGDVPMNAMLAWLEKQGEQKPAWSEEDEQFFNTALWHISYSISNSKSTDINCDTTDWFKSLKYRIKGE